VPQERNLRLLQKDYKNDRKEVIKCRKYAVIVPIVGVMEFADTSEKQWKNGGGAGCGSVK
jgi:hypothetical protein